MIEPRDRFTDPIWERQAWEDNHTAWKAFEDYMSIPSQIRKPKTLINEYRLIIEQGADYRPSFSTEGDKPSNFKPGYIVPGSAASIRKWSSVYRWPERSFAYEQNETQDFQEKFKKAKGEVMDNRVKTAVDDIESFRVQSLILGKNAITVGARMLEIIKQSMDLRFPLYEDQEGRKLSLTKPLSNADLADLEKISLIYHRANTGITNGSEVMAVSLGVKEALEVVAKSANPEEFA